MSFPSLKDQHPPLLSMYPDLNPTEHPKTEGGGASASISSLMSSRTSGSRFQWQPVKLW